MPSFVDKLDSFIDRWLTTLGGLLFMILLFLSVFNTYQLIHEKEEESERANMVLCEGLADTRIIIQEILAISANARVNFSTDDPELSRYLDYREDRSVALSEAVQEALVIPPECVEYINGESE